MAVPDIEFTPPSFWDVIIFLATLPLSVLGIAILVAIYTYYVSAVPSLIWRCFGKTGPKNKPPSNP